MWPYVENTLGTLLRSQRGRDAKLFHKGPAFANLPDPSLSVTSPECGPSNSPMSSPHGKDGGNEVKGGFKFGQNHMGNVYGGPRPVLGHGPHRYLYQVVTGVDENRFCGGEGDEGGACRGRFKARLSLGGSGLAFSSGRCDCAPAFAAGFLVSMSCW